MDQKEMTTALASLITAAVSEHLAPTLRSYYSDVTGVYFDGDQHGRYVDWGTEDQDEGDVLITTGDGPASVSFYVSKREFTRLAAAAVLRALDWS